MGPGCPRSQQALTALPPQSLAGCAVPREQERRELGKSPGSPGRSQPVPTGRPDAAAAVRFRNPARVTAAQRRAGSGGQAFATALPTAAAWLPVGAFASFLPVEPSVSRGPVRSPNPVPTGSSRT